MRLRYMLFVVIGAFALGLFATTADAQRKRKLPASAYLKAAKIALQDQRYDEAQGMLDSLIMHYGPYAEGYHWLAQMQVDFLNETTEFGEQVELVTRLNAYVDSIGMVCADENAEKRNRKKCDDYSEQADSTKARWWAQFYNAGVDYLKEMQNYREEIDNADDSAVIAFNTEELDRSGRMALDNFKLATMLEPEDHRALVGVAEIYERKKRYDSANIWYERALPLIEVDSVAITQTRRMAYNYIFADDYCSSIPHFQRYLAAIPADQSIPLQMDMAIVYNRCEMPDSATAIYYNVLAIDSTNVSALRSLSAVYRNRAIDVNKQIQEVNDGSNPDELERLTGLRDALFDSASTNYRIVFNTNPDNLEAAENLALMRLIARDYEEAVVALERATTLAPEKSEHWISLGDAQLQLKNWEASAAAYEKAVELDPSNQGALEQLKLLYIELKRPSDRERVEKMLGQM